MDRVAEIKRLYLHATRATIERDLVQAIELFRTLDTDTARQRAAVYMDGLSQMRSEWKSAGAVGERTRAGRPTPQSKPAAH